MAERGAPIGNKNGEKSRVFHDAMRRACVQENFKRINQGVEQALTKAAEGERWALELVRDTLDGKPKQQIEGPGDNGEFFFQAIKRTIIDNAKDE